MLCLIFEIDFINQAKVCLIVQKSGKAFGLSVRPINLILSLTTSTQAVLCILLSSYRGALRAPVLVHGKIPSTACVDVVKLSIRLIGLTLRPNALPDFWTVRQTFA